MLRPSPLVDQAANHLRARIAAGQWPVGTKLPAETALATALGVGRSTVREALRALAGAGLVQARQGAGVFVLATTADDWPAVLRRAAVTDVYEVRVAVEVEAAGLAALRRTDADLTALRAALAARRAAGGDEEFVAADIDLHAAVVAAAHNPVLTAVFTDFRPVLHRALVDLVELLALRVADPDTGDAAHAALVDAIAAGDPETARRVLRDELDQTLGRLRDR
ncbi:FCD domain-containing protein [Actinosynnema sp. NPDC047251]|uniref:Transcriptional regulator, GntR family n=1 Tax=Saccharothrix espanaensis (strain ATCC 51144 / DSM 44229 / JCM 9112 / NBRC 15066 / NRRL 15764) TaxID=1179773 RepID=K0JW53_SACES|nr:FCD domain-containing protein [Saccharothrix espanaensis]CCH29682.1 Transcriptional regulator, GntR family [Saccharothrix espanaensis DSM 44229]